MVYSIVRNTGPLAVLLVALSLTLSELWLYQISLYLTYAVAATGLGLAWGTSGILSLGHGLFMAIGAYFTAVTLMSVDAGWISWPLALACTLPSVALAWTVSIGVFRRQSGNSTSFSMITLALALAGGQVIIAWSSITGGFNGLLGIPNLPGVSSITTQYWLAAATLVLVCIGYAWLRAAPLGTLWLALSENEHRLQFLGYDTARLKSLAFALSGFCAGLGGAVYAQQQGIVTPDLTGFAFCGSLLLFVAVGGRYAIQGPVIGAVLIGVLESELRNRFDWWELGIAILFIVVVLRFPRGIGGLLPQAGIRNRTPDLTAPSLPGSSDPLSCQMKQISVRIGTVQILNKLDFSATEGQTTCIIGPNGAGKSSSFNALTGLLPLSGGTVSLDHTQLAQLSPMILARAGVSRKFQAPTVFGTLTIRENLLLALWAKRATARELLSPTAWRWTSAMLEELCIRFSFLTDGDRPALDLSHGQRQMLELAMVLVTEPRLLLLDEPCAGLSADETAQVVEVISWARIQRPMTIIIVEHDMGLVEALGHTVSVFHQGSFLSSGTVAEIRADNDVLAVYAGGKR